MADKFPQRFLMVVIAAMTIICGIKPALLSHVILIAGLLLIFIWRDVRGKFTAVNPVTTVLLGLVIAWAAASLQWTLLPARGLYDLLVLMILAALALQLPAGIMHLNATETDKTLKLFIALSLASILIFMMDVHFNLISQRAFNGINWSVDLPMANISRNGFCIVLLFWPLACYACCREMQLWVFFLWLVIALSLLMTDSAAGRVSFAAGTLVFLFASWRPQWVRMGMAAILLAGLLLAVPLGGKMQNLMEGSGYTINNSFLHRGEIWRFATERIKEKPIIGWGFASARAIPNEGQISKYQGHNPLKSIIPMHPHNWFLHAYLELGIVGAILLTALWLWILHQTSYLHRSVQPAALSAYAVAMVIGTFSIGLWQTWWFSALIFIAVIIQLLDHEARRTR